MDVIGHIVLKGLGQIKNARLENLAADPVTPPAGALWYNTTDGVYRGFDGTSVVSFSLGGNTAAILSELDAVETSAGLNADGTLPSLAATNYVTASPSLFAALVALDAQIKTNTDAIATAATAATALSTKVAAVITSEGLNADGSFAGYVGTNYVAGVTNAHDAIIELDTATSLNADAISANVTAIAGKVSNTGDAMSGNLAFGGTNRVTGLAAPQNAGDAVNMAFVEARLAGLTWENPVDGMVADHTAIATALSVGDRYVNTTDNKIYTVTTAGADGATAVWSVGETLADGAAFFDRTSDTGYTFNGVQCVQFTGGGQIVGGVGLVKTGNVLDINMGAGIAQLPSDEVGIDVLVGGGLFLTVDGATDSTDTAAQLSIKLDGTSLARSATGLKVAAAGITATEIAAAVAGSGLTGGAGAALSVVAGTGIALTGGAVTLDTTYVDARYINTTGDTLTGPLLTAGAPTAALEVANMAYVDAVSSALANSSFLYTSGAADTTHVVVHNIGSKFCTVTVVDSADNVILADNIHFDSTNQLTVTFPSAINCKVFVEGKYVPA